MTNDLFRISTDQVVTSNTPAVESLAALASGFAAVAAAAAATAEAVEASRATIGAVPGASPGASGAVPGASPGASGASPGASPGASGASGSAKKPNGAEGTSRILGEIGVGALAAGKGAELGSRYGLAGVAAGSVAGAGLAAVFGSQAVDWLEKGTSWLEKQTNDRVIDPIVNRFRDIDFNRKIPQEIQDELDRAISGQGYSPFAGAMVDPNFDGGADIHINLNMDKKTLAETSISREELAEAQALGRARVRLDGRR